jgi:hypothetical protein
MLNLSNEDAIMLESIYGGQDCAVRCMIGKAQAGEQVWTTDLAIALDVAQGECDRDDAEYDFHIVADFLCWIAGVRGWLYQDDDAYWMLAEKCEVTGDEWHVTCLDVNMGNSFPLHEYSVPFGAIPVGGQD